MFEDDPPGVRPDEVGSVVPAAEKFVADDPGNRGFEAIGLFALGPVLCIFMDRL